MSIHSGEGISVSSASALAPASASTSALIGQRDANTKKTTRDEVDETELDQRPFSIRDPSEPFARPKQFTPICLLSRAQLPLAFLDTAQSGSRLFSALIGILEHCHEDDATVLLARAELEKRLYAVERVKSRTYALCKLHASVSELEMMEKSHRIVRAEEPQRKRRAVETGEKGGPWWAKAAVEMPQDIDNADNGRETGPALTMRRVMEAPQKISPQSHGPQDEMTRPVIHDDRIAADLEPALSQMSPDDALHDLAKHYMEALYIERTSLAYFTKGPLSRARAIFASNHSGMTPTHLVEFLRESILTSNIMDKKYRESISEFVKELPIPSLGTPEDVAKRKKRKSKKWKTKRGKAGFFVGEEDFVERWWRADDALSSPETADAALRRRLPKIRIRETFLQIILVLEVLAWEASNGADIKIALDAPAAEQALGDEVQQLESQGPSDIKNAKAKKKQDLPALLDTMLDKLCIWHSLDSHSPAKSRTGEKLGTEDEANDYMKSFCIDVILPFYVSRVAQYAILVNKKLGGPSATPVKRSKSVTTRKPGEPAVRRPPEKKARQPLARVSTDTLNRCNTKPHRPAPLHRSATDTDALQSHVKRETSESPSLASVPFALAPGKDRRARVNPLEHIASRQRVVDLSAMTQASEVKLRKKAERAELIKEAVEGIKKPNRALAVKEGAERADESFAKALSGAKGGKSQQRGRKAEAEGGGARRSAATMERSEMDGLPRSSVITATPARLGRGALTTQPPTSSISMVPSSSARLRAPPLGIPQSSDLEGADDAAFAIPQTGHRPRRIDMDVVGKTSTAVNETPSRGFAKFMPRGLASQPGAGVLESPIMRRTASAVQATPLKAPARLDFPAAIDGTPLPRSRDNVNIDVGDTPIRPVFNARKGGRQIELNGGASDEAGKHEERGEKSIYAALGWDDDGDYDLLT